MFSARRHRGLLALCALVLLTASPAAEAHLVGKSFEKQVGEYLVDVGYDMFELQPNQKTIFNFALVQNAGKPNWEYAPFNKIFVSFRQSDREIFGKTITLSEPIPAYAPFTFPSAGDYTLAVRFQKDDRLLAETTFPVPVGSGFSVEMLGFQLLLALNAAGLVIIAIGYLRSRKARERRSA